MDRIVFQTDCSFCLDGTTKAVPNSSVYGGYIDEVYN